MRENAERDNLVVVERGLAALAAGDVAAFLERLHPAAGWHLTPSGTLKGNYRGRDQIAGFFAHAAAETNDTFRLRAHAFAGAGDRVFVLHSATATRRGVDDEWSAVLVFTLSDGLAVSVQHYSLDYPAWERFWR